MVPAPKTEKRLKAEVRRLRKLLHAKEREGEVADRIVDIVYDSIASIAPIEPPKISIPDNLHLRDETALLMFSDSHIGKKSKSYNHRVFVKRLRKLEASMMSIITALRSIRPIKKLVIAFLGDIVDAESVYPSQAVERISMPVLDQIWTTGVPELTRFLLFCLQNFEEVECYCVRGNHGRQSWAKWTASQSTNWDFIIYKALEAVTRDQPRLKWNIDHKDWKTMFKINGSGFLGTHGDMIRRYYSTPHYGLERQSERWQNAYRDKMRLTYFLYGHFHSADAGKRHNQLVYFLNGSWVTDDEFAEEKIGVASVPEQLLIGVHPRFGCTWRYVLQLK